MPGTYAHFKFGDDVKKLVSPKTALIINEFPEVFYIGLHGPDLLFYYNALTKNKVNTLGFNLHKESGKDYFTKAADIIRTSGYDQACISYTLGFLCHFALDVTCHGFVNENVAKKIAGHLEIESELERELLLEAGRNPQTAILTGHLHASTENAAIIQNFFREFSVREIKKSIKDMKFYLNMLVAKNPVKRSILYIGLKVAGMYETHKGLVINRKENPACRESTATLRKLFDKAEKMAVRLLDDYVDYIFGKKELEDIYSYNFETIRVGD